MSANLTEEEMTDTKVSISITDILCNIFWFCFFGFFIGIGFFIVIWCVGVFPIRNSVRCFNQYEIGKNGTQTYAEVISAHIDFNSNHNLFIQ